MARTEIKTDGAPTPGGSYSQGIRNGQLVYTAGQLGIDPATHKLVEGGIEAQAEQTIRNVSAILAAEGATLADVVKVTTFLADMSLFPGYDAVYRTHFPEPRPARSTVGVNLMPGYLIEIEVVAIVPD
jgi:2-iminobutanoate/2-iminopropanoate deaminase